MGNLHRILETMFRRVWEDGDTDAFDEMYELDSTIQGLGENVLIGPKEFKMFHIIICNILSDIKITIDKSIESGDWIAVIATISAIDKNTGLPVTTTGQYMGRIEDGKIREAYNHVDFISLFTKMGLMPIKTLEYALMGVNIYEESFVESR